VTSQSFVEAFLAAVLSLSVEGLTDRRGTALIKHVEPECAIVTARRHYDVRLPASSWEALICAARASALDFKRKLGVETLHRDGKTSGKI
jgi:hypothetical protein